MQATTALLALTLAACGGSSSSDSSSSATSAGGASPAISSGIVTGASAAEFAPVFFAASSYSAAQGAGSVSLTVLRVGDASSAISVAYATADASAVAGTDYAATSGTLQWAENDSTARTITVPITAAGAFAGTKTFTVSLSDPSSAAQIAAPDSTVVSIMGSAGAAPGSLQLSTAAYAVAQSTGELLVTVNRMNGSSGAASVQYATSDSTAVAGTDYTAASGSLSWADGDASSKTFSIAVSDAAPFTGTKVFSVNLLDPTSGTALGSPGSATVTIDGGDTPGAGTLHLSAANYSVAQKTGSVVVSVARLGGSVGEVSVDYATAAGTAVSGADFTAAHGTLTWADGDSTLKSFTIPIGDATPFSGSKSFALSLAHPGGGATISSPGTASVTIAGDASSALGSLQLSAASYGVSQSAGSLALSVQRIGGVSGTVSVAYAFKNGTAIGGVDFTGTGGTLQWADGDGAAKTIDVAISTATPFSGTKSFTVSLSAAGGGAVLSTPSTAGISIAGAASAAVGNMQLSASQYAVAQSAHAVTVTVNRIGGASGAASVSYATTGGTAVAGTDYTAASGTLSWAEGDAKSKTFAIAIGDAAPFAGTKTFGVVLSQPSTGAALSSPSSASVTVTGSASAAVGQLQLGVSSDTVAASADVEVITVTRTGGTSGAVSVAYSTGNGTAVAGTNYTATSGTLSWADGDTSSKTISIPVASTASFSGAKTFLVALSAPTNGATLGTPSSATVTLNGTGSPGSGGSSGPSMPGNLLMTGQTSNSISLSWSAATPGSNPVDHYRVYRNGTAYDTSKSTSYTDNGATNATDGGYGSGAFSQANSIYSYAVSAVDADGNEGPKTTQIGYNVYMNGSYAWAGDYSYSATANYKDTSGSPESGGYDIEVNVNGAYGGFLPYAGDTVPLWDLEAGAFAYFSIDLKPTANNQTWNLSMVSRLPPGDVFPWATVNVGSYGPTPVPGKWATYKIPLSKLSIGKTSFEGSISGTTLTVTSVDSGVGVDAGGYITGNGVKPGTYVIGHNAKGGPGTYTVSPSQNVSSTSMTEQRTGVYKFELADQTGDSSNHFYVDNVRFTAQ